MTTIRLMEQVFFPFCSLALCGLINFGFKLTGVRDYIHVMDLASGHVAALAKIEKEHLRYRVRPWKKFISKVGEINMHVNGYGY